MDILTKNIKFKSDLPIDLISMEKALADYNINNPLRFAIVKVDDNELTINVSYINS